MYAARFCGIGVKVKTSHSSEHVIVGAGIMGLLTAYFLQQQGREVLILERNDVGQEASWAGGGILSPLLPWRYPQAVTDLVRWSQTYYPQLCQELSQSSGIDPEWTRSGLLTIETLTGQISEWSKQTQTEVQSVTGNTLHELEPQLSSQFTSGIWMPQVAQVRNPRLVKSLKRVLLTSGVEILDHTAVTKFLVKQGQITGVSTNHGDIHGAKVIVASGAWSAKLIAEFGLTIDVEPVRGQMILLEAEPQLLQHIILANDHYLIPRKDGKILVGSTLEYVGFDKQTTQSARDMLYKVAETIAPCLTQYSIIGHWAGLRPGSKSSIPTICEHPQIKGLFINAGHFRNGVVMAPASAKLLVNLLLGQATPFNPMLYKVKSPY